MSSEPTTDPPPDRLITILSEQTSAIERAGDLLGEFGRDIGHVKNELRGVLNAFAEQHGKRESAELDAAHARQKSQQTADLILGQVRALALRLGPIESRIAGLELHLSARQNDNNNNNNGGDSG